MKIPPYDILPLFGEWRPDIPKSKKIMDDQTRKETKAQMCDTSHMCEGLKFIVKIVKTFSADNFKSTSSLR